MDNKKNIIIFLLCVIFILNFLIFIKLKTYRQDNFMDSPVITPQPYQSIDTSTNGEVVGYIKKQALLYYILLNNINNQSDEIFGLIIYISCKSYKVTGATLLYSPILDELSKGLPVNTDIRNLQASLTPSQKTILNSQTIPTYQEYKVATNKPETISKIISSFTNLKTNLALSDPQKLILNNIIQKWFTSKNSYFTIDTFNTLSLSGTDVVKEWSNFFKNCDTAIT
jgi:hypothetical protein